MDKLEYWIWEHSAKYGMTEVMKRMKCTFAQVSLPNSWLSALFLCKVKDEWEKPGNKITSSELNSLRQSLISTFKHYKKELKQIIRASDLVQLDLCCKASFLVMRSTGCEPGVKRRAQDQLFPIWSDSLWEKIKTSFGLKDDFHLDEIKKFYIEIKLKLGQIKGEKEILDQFGCKMQKHFPSLIVFMQGIKLSMLERIHRINVRLEPQLEFVHLRLSSDLKNELVILNLWEEVQRKKFQSRAAFFLKEKSKLTGGKLESSTNCAMFTLPTVDHTCENSSQLYPPCFTSNPFMPTHIILKKDGQLKEYTINRNLPRAPDGKSFKPHWFSDASVVSLKREMEDLSEGTVKARKRLQNDTSHIVLNDVLKHVNRGGSKIIANKVKSNTLISCKPSLLVRLEAERVKSWIANQISDSAEIPEVDSDDNASSKRVEETSETCENSTDVEEASSTASSSCSYYSKQNITRWRHLSKTKIELEEGGVLKKMDELGEGQGNLQSYQKPVRNLRRSGKVGVHSPSHTESTMPRRATGTLPLNEELSNYQTPKEQSSMINPSSGRFPIKRKQCDGRSMDEHNGKRNQSDCLFGGDHILSEIVETLRKHSGKLRMYDSKSHTHSEELDVCVERVISVHQKLSDQ